jgi:hypothetical protein
MSKVKDELHYASKAYYGQSAGFASISTVKVPVFIAQDPGKERDGKHSIPGE